MSWLVSFLIAVLTAAVGTVAAGVVASLGVDWYHISSFEGGAGYFVVFIALLGLIAGFLVGLVVSRLFGARRSAGFLRSLGVSAGVVIAVAGAAAGIAWALADIPPTITDRELLLAVEVRWPPGVRPPTVGASGNEPSVSLHSIPALSHTVRASEHGPLWLEDAHLSDGQWIVPGAVRIFTARGSRMLSVASGEARSEGFLLPLSAHPGTKDLAWSDWLPRLRPGVPRPADRLELRYRVLPVSEPVRVQRIGPFEVATIATGFFETTMAGRNVFAASANFTVSYHGHPVDAGADSAAVADSTVQRTGLLSAVATVAGPSSALIIRGDDDSGSARCQLVAEAGDSPRLVPLDACNMPGEAVQLTTDSARFRAGSGREQVRGTIDRTTFADAGLYLFTHAVLDTRTLTVHRFAGDTIATGVPSVPPLGLSPDERSFARYGYAGGTETKPLLIVTDYVADGSYTLPIDRARMRFANFSSLEPAWLLHHFEWRRGPGGTDRLEVRKGYVPLPYHGMLSADAAGASYRLEPAGAPLRTALMAYLTSTFGAERMAADSDAYQMPMKIEGQAVNIAASGDFDYVLVSLADGSAHGSLIARIASRFDAELATGKYDALFRP